MTILELQNVVLSTITNSEDLEVYEKHIKEQKVIFGEAGYPRKSTTREKALALYNGEPDPYIHKCLTINHMNTVVCFEDLRLEKQESGEVKFIATGKLIKTLGDNILAKCISEKIPYKFGLRSLVDYPNGNKGAARIKRVIAYDLISD